MEVTENNGGESGIKDKLWQNDEVCENSSESDQDKEENVAAAGDIPNNNNNKDDKVLEKREEEGSGSDQANADDASGRLDKQQHQKLQTKMKLPHGTLKQLIVAQEIDNKHGRNMLQELEDQEQEEENKMLNGMRMGVVAAIIMGVVVAAIIMGVVVAAIIAAIMVWWLIRTSRA